MLVGWRHWAQRFVTLPWLVQAGLSLVALGGIGDVVCHSVNGLSPSLGHALHVLILVGMVTTIAGILLDAAH